MNIMKKILYLFTISLFISGCWNYRELNDISLASAIAISKDNDNFIITVQIMSTKKESSDGSSTGSTSKMPITTLTSKGKTFHEALKKLTELTPKQIYIGHTNLFILDESIGIEGVNDFIDFLVRSPESRKQFNVMMSKKNDADDILTILTPIEEQPAQDIMDSTENIINNYGTSYIVTFDELLARQIANGIEMIIPTIIINGNIEEGRTEENTMSSIPKVLLKIGGVGVFKKDKLVGYLNEKETLAYNLITGNLKKSELSFKCDNENYASMGILNNKSKINVKIKNNKPFVTIEINGDAVQSELNCDINMESVEERKKMEIGINNEIKKIVKETVEKAKKELNSDVFGFGQYLYRFNYKYWKEHKSQWDNLFKNIEYEVKVNYRLTKKGSALKSVKEK